MTRYRETAKHLKAFEDWYAADRDARKVSQKLAVPLRTVYEWLERFGWHARADQRDAEAAEIAAKAAVKRKAAALIRHRQAGELMQRKGIAFFAKNEVERAPDAISAIKDGIKIEREAEGFPDYVHQILTLNEEQLLKRRAEVEAGLFARIGADRPEASDPAEDDPEAGEGTD